MINFKIPATNILLYQIAQNVLGIPIIILMKDELTSENFRQHNCFILNLENSYEDGSHWVGVYRNKNQVFYYDPFGFPPSKQHYDIFKMFGSFFYNIRETQHPSSILCGYYVLYFLFYMYKSNIKNQKERFNNFLNSFYQNIQRNDKVVKDFFKSYDT